MQERRVRTVRASGPGGPARTRMRSARTGTAAVGRPPPDDPAHPGGLPMDPPVSVPSPAGPRTRRPRRPGRPMSHRAPGTGPTGCGTGRTRSSRWRSPSRTRPCSSCPAAPRRPDAAAGSRWRRRAAATGRGSGRRRWWAVRGREHVLEGQRHARQRPEHLPAAGARPPRGRRRALSASTWRNAERVSPRPRRCGPGGRR